MLTNPKTQKNTFLTGVYFTCFFVLFLLYTLLRDDKAELKLLGSDRVPSQLYEHRILQEKKLLFIENPDLSLGIAANQYQLLKENVEKIKREKRLITSQDKEKEYVAFLKYRGKNWKTKVSLKGLYQDHLVGNKWSFRVKTKSSKLFRGLNRFSLQNPITRKVLNEWFLMRAADSEGLITLRYDFAKLKLNNQNVGIYLIEEFFEKRLIEFNQSREGLLYKITPGVRLLQKGKYLKNKNFKDMHEKFIARYKHMQEGKISASKVYDLKYAAKYFALSDLFGAHHGHYHNNYVIYLNPINGLAYPIPFDNNALKDLNKYGLSFQRTHDMTVWDSTNGRELFLNKEFLNLYLNQIDLYRQPRFLESILNKNKSEILRFSKFLKNEFSEYNFQKQVIETLRSNQIWLSNFLSVHGTLDKLSSLIELAIKDQPNWPSQIPKKVGYLERQQLNKSEWKHLLISKDTISLKSSFLYLNKTLRITEGQSLVLNPGDRIEFGPNGKIYTNGPLIFNGTQESPVIIDGKSNKTSGILVSKSERKSILEYTEFKNMGNPSEGLVKPTSSVTFYDSLVSVKNCKFINNQISDDFLNIVATTFYIENVTIIGSAFDALDVDFGIGTIRGMNFERIGNDALDFSGSKVLIQKIRAKQVDDKVLSAGEGTSVEIKDLIASDFNIGLTSKDLSFINARDISIEKGKLGLTAFQKKSEFGGGIINFKNLSLKNLEKDKLIDKNSMIFEGLKPIKLQKAKNKTIKMVLYGK